MVKKILSRQSPQPISLIKVNRILISIVIVLAMLAGYYHAVSENWERQYRKLQVKTQLLEQDLTAYPASPSGTMNDTQKME